jgi:uncharacterized Tic20 family protein
MDAPDPQLPPPSSALPPVPFSSDDKIWAICCHLSLLIGVGFLLPLIVWLAKRNDSPLVAAHAREALNFHLSLLVYAIVCIPLVFFCIGYLFLFAIGIAGLILAIIAAVEASNGGFFRYPLTIPFFR